MVTVAPQVSKVELRAVQREQALAAQAASDAAALRTKRLLWATIGVALAALVGLAAFLLTRHTPTAVEALEHTPANTTADGGIAIDRDLRASGQLDSALPTIAVYLDYMCPVCTAFEDANFETLVQMASAGEANVVMHPVAILDRASLGTNFSTRAAAAAAWIADQAPESFVNFHYLMFVQQPAENTEGLSNDQIAEIARQAGAPDSVAAGIADGTATARFGPWAAATTTDAVNGAVIQGFTGTPYIAINGSRFMENWMDPTVLRQAALAAGPSR